MDVSFKCGDRVKLKDGGAVMAVTGTNQDNTGRPMVWCAWFDADHRHRTAGYAPSALVPIEIAELGPTP
jgi:uncharacterized protein YodC (DUF2158 family)